MAALAPIINGAKALYATRRDAAAGTDFDAGLFKEALSDIAQAMVDANRGRPPPAPLPGMKPKALDRAIATLHDLGFTPAYTDANIAGDLGVRSGFIAPAGPAIAATGSPSGASTTAAPGPAIGDRPPPTISSARVSDNFDSLVDPRGSLASFEAMEANMVPTTPAPPLRGLPDTLSPWLGSPSDAVLAGWREIVAGFDAVEDRVPIDELVPNRKPRNAKDRLILYYHDGNKRTRKLLRARFEAPPPPVHASVDVDAAMADAAVTGEASDDMVIGSDVESDGPDAEPEHSTAVGRPTQSGRSLTAGERALAETVFGSSANYNASINYDAVTLYLHAYPDLGILQGPSTIVTPDGNMYLGAKAALIKDFSSESVAKKARFIHEMTHVWQKQRGIDIKGRAIDEHFWAFLDGSNPYRYLPLTPGKPFAEYGVEQQGQIVEDYFRLRSGAEIRPGRHDPKVQPPHWSVYEKLIPFVPKLGG